MNVISKKTLEKFWRQHPDSEAPLRAWLSVCKKAKWKSLDEVQEFYPHADAVGDCTVFNIGGNKYRIAVKIRYLSQRIYITRVMTHREYDRKKWKDDC